GDTAIAWLLAGLPRMIAGNLQAIGGVDVVPQSRVRDITARVAGSARGRVTEQDALDIARRIGASWAVTGGVSSGNKGYLLDLTVRHVIDPRRAERFTI